MNIKAEMYNTLSVYFEPEETLFEQKDLWDECGKDSKKVKKLIIN